MRNQKHRKIKYNTHVQSYKGIKIRLIEYTPQHFDSLRAKRFMLISEKAPLTRQNVWIPNCYLESDGTLKDHINIDFVFVTAARQNKLKYAYIDIPDWLKAKTEGVKNAI